MQPKVSVIIPAYNTEAYIAQAIESVLQQTLSNIEVIVVDDASTDKTVDIARSFSDKRLKVLVNEQNLGASGARNRAIREARGEWVAVLDSDDWYAPERLEKLLQIADAENADMIADDLYLIQDGQNSPWSTLISQSGECINHIKIIDPVYFVKTDVYGKPGLHLGISKPLFKRDFLIKNGIEYDRNLTIVQDFWLVMNCLIKGAKFVLVPEPYYFYRSRQGSLTFSNNPSNRERNLEQCCCKISDFLTEEDIFNLNPDLGRALSKNLRVFQRNLAYYRVIGNIKQKQWLRTLAEMLSNPYFWLQLIIRLPGIIARRIQYYLLGNKLAFNMIYASKSNKSK
ncbi:glycosyltransferase family 2 protein [Nostoc sp. 106C]|uniref:glycosyltransferase family 2 protein n=1 Tax=Nostoc sp. 106C TaxID=1932667 RepID=UPI000A3A27DD|nr:glycosyltransferase family 2 protein [Nostoc sp. 106C]OUL22568.1 glycosyl transferase [Nostoc sp. 106C]OUL27755.1 glycosyl transferase [Nostoc sp. RF31YmG]